MFVTLTNWSERDITAKEMINKINARLAKEIKGAQIFAFGPPAFQVWEMVPDLVSCCRIRVGIHLNILLKMP